MKSPFHLFDNLGIRLAGKRESLVKASRNKNKMFRAKREVETWAALIESQMLRGAWLDTSEADGTKASRRSSGMPT